MGATTFMTKWEGASASEAFRGACEVGGRLLPGTRKGRIPVLRVHELLNGRASV